MFQSCKHANPVAHRQSLNLSALRFIHPLGSSPVRANPSAHLGILVHGFLHVLQQVVVGSALLLVDVDDAVQVGEVAVQVHPLSVAAAYEPILYLSGLSGKAGGGVNR